ncbi:TRAP transporter substrate-binding protein [Gynuella sp.]|uniref:TRAP transporter substrate-binding protein n=1 Tax=Gynuella sp. TaxID=2969146 RepID=UPI003D0FA2E4
MLRKAIKIMSVGIVTMGFATSVFAADVVLRLHQMLPPQATIPAKVLEPWAKKVESESGGRISVQLYPSMQLGGKPSDLIDQARDGVVDVIWTLFGYTPGRYPKTEVFELPFIGTTAEATSMAFQEYYDTYMTGDKGFRGLKVLAVHTHGPGLLHTRDSAIEKLEDLKGLKLRGTSRVINAMLSSLGASPLGMPVPAVPEALSKGVIDGTVVPWEVTPSVKIAELAPYHTEFSGRNGLYTATFLFAMNQDTYDNLPADLKKVIDNNSGMALAQKFGQAMDAGDKRGYDIAVKANNTIVKLDDAETARWKKVSKTVTEDWVKEMDKRKMDGTKLYQAAKALIEKYDSQ